MRLVGELVVTRSRLEDTLHRVEAHVPFQEWRALQEHNAGIERHLRDLREGVMRVRLVPVGEIFRRMPFVVRDLARDSGKRVRLELLGQATEIDKFLIERMMDPVLHLVRNAISHAIETPDERIAAGKPPDATIRLSASTAGETVVLEIADDGRGIDVADVARRARDRGMAVPEGTLDSGALLDILCASGFSTRDEADRGSGRGVGMAVVRSTVQDLGGTLAVDSEAGRGTAFRMTLPLTLAITDAIIAHVGPHTFAVPQAAVRELIEVEAASLRTIERNELLAYRGGTLPIIRLSQLFAPRHVAAPPLSRHRRRLRAGRRRPARRSDRRSARSRRQDDCRPVDPCGRRLGRNRTGRRPRGADSGCVRVESDGAASAAIGHRWSVGMSESAVETRATAETPAAHTYILFTVAGTTYALQEPAGPAHGDARPCDAGAQCAGVRRRRRVLARAGGAGHQSAGAVRIRTDRHHAAHAAARGPARRRAASACWPTTPGSSSASPPTSIQPPHEAIGGLSGNYLEGVATVGERIVLILNLREVVETTPTTIA